MPGNAKPERRAVIFDMDGLLFDSGALYHDAILAAAREFGAVRPGAIERPDRLDLASVFRTVGGDLVQTGQHASQRHKSGKRFE